MEVIKLAQENFDKEIAVSTPVLVDFYATWCGPCRMMAPIIEEIAIEYAGKLKVCKLDTDECPEIAGKFGIESIPTFIVLKNGKPVDTIMGYKPKNEFVKFVGRNIGQA